METRTSEENETGRKTSSSGAWCMGDEGTDDLKTGEVGRAGPRGDSIAAVKTFESEVERMYRKLKPMVEVWDTSG